MGIIDSYDLDSNGTFETSIPTPARTGSLAASEFDPDLHQPYLDETILGYRMQLPYSIGIDVEQLFATGSTAQADTAKPH